MLNPALLIIIANEIHKKKKKEIKAVSEKSKNIELITKERKLPINPRAKARIKTRRIYSETKL